MMDCYNYSCPFRVNKITNSYYCECIICCRVGVGMEFDDFCSHGERKKGGDNDAVD